MSQARAHALIIIAPEYNHGYPGVLKHVLDTNLKEYIRKGNWYLWSFSRRVRRHSSNPGSAADATRAWFGNYLLGRKLSGAQSLFDEAGQIKDEATHVKRLDKFLNVNLDEQGLEIRPRERTN